MSNLLVHALPDGSAEANAAAILAGLVSWWALDDNAATPSFVDSHGAHHLTLRLGATTPNSSTQSSATSKSGRAWASGRADNGMLYIPRSNTALDMTSDTIHTIGGWFKLDFTGGVTAFVIGRIGSAFAKLHFWVTIDSVDGLIKARYSATGAATAATAASTIAAGSGEWCLVIASYNRTAGTMTIRVRKQTTGAMSSGSVALGAAISSVADTCNFTIGEGLEADSSYDAANNRSGVLTADECFYGAFAVTDAIFDYLFNAGAGRSYSQVVAADTTTLPRGGFKLYEREGRLGIKVAHNAAPAAVDGDASFSSVGLLLHMDGANGSTTITDSGPLSKTIVANGASALSTAQSKFGGASVLLGTNNYLGMVDDDNVMRFDAFDSSVELWAYFTANPGSYGGDPGIMLFSQGIVGARACELWINSASLSSCTVKATMWAGTTAYTAQATGVNLPLNTWHFFQWVRDGTTLRLGINGVQVATVSVGTASMNNSSDPLLIGRFLDAVFNYWLPGYVDEFRVTKGVARPIALPTAPFPSSAGTPATYWSAWETTASFAPGSFYALAFEIHNGVPRIFVDGDEQAGAFLSGSGSQASFIGLDTTQTGYPLRIGAFDGWIDECSVDMTEAIYTADYTPEIAPFPDPGTVIEEGATVLHLDRGLDWDGTPEPHAVMLSSETNGVSAALLCERGDADHELVLLEDAPFELFGKGEQQEPTRVAFGTLDNIVRDWIVTSATPQQGMAVHIEGIVYNPAVYEGTMPHQGGEALPLPEPPGGWIIAGTPDGFAPDFIIAGDPADPSTDYVLAGAPDDPSTWLEPEGPP